jgi:hypothetical protein
VGGARTLQFFGPVPTLAGSPPAKTEASPGQTGIKMAFPFPNRHYFCQAGMNSPFLFPNDKYVKRTDFEAKVVRFCFGSA